MRNLRRIPKGIRLLSLLSSCASVSLAVATCAPSQTAEIDSFSRAVASQRKEEAQAFITEHRSSPLVVDLIESLQPDVALQVCSSMSSDLSSDGRRACQNLQKTIATNAGLGSSIPDLEPPPAKLDEAPPPAKLDFVSESQADDESSSEAAQARRKARKDAVKAAEAKRKAREEVERQEVEAALARRKAKKDAAEAAEAKRKVREDIERRAVEAAKARRKAQEVAPRKPVAISSQLHTGSKGLGLEVLTFHTAREVVQREPLGVTDVFYIADRIAYAHARISNPGAPTRVLFRWLYRNSRLSDFEQEVGTSSGWRTWSHTNLRPGPWRVQLVAKDGTIIAENRFTVK